jgi:hypothetical protein
MNNDTNQLFKQAILEKDTLQAISALHKGADINMIVSRAHGNALMYSICVYNWEIIDYMLDEPELDINYVDEDGFSVITVLIIHAPNYEPTGAIKNIIKKIINKVDKKLFLISGKIMLKPIPSFFLALENKKFYLSKMILDRLTKEDLLPYAESIKTYINTYKNPSKEVTEIFDIIKTKLNI